MNDIFFLVHFKATDKTRKKIECLSLYAFFILADVNVNEFKM